MTDYEVNYICACGKAMPLLNLFFCKYCVVLRCPKCVSHEVDSYYCPHCLENIPSGDAKANKNRCFNCLECPNCFSNLQHRSAQVPLVKREGGKVGFGQFKKVFYLQCFYCLWTTRDILGIPDKNQSSGPWFEESEEDTWIGDATNYYRHLIQKEKVEMEKTRRQRRGSFLGLGSLGLSDKRLPFTRIRTSFSMAGSGQYNENIIQEFKPVEPEEDVEKVDEKYYSKPGNVHEVTSIESRVKQPSNEVINSKELLPHYTHLLVKRSQRCRECEHNLSKPEFNPSSIKFKIHQIALRFVPRFRIVKKVKLDPGKHNKVLFSLTNPTEFDLPMEFSPIPEDHPYFNQINAKAEFPSTTIVLAARDDTAQYEDASLVCSEFDDDPKFVVDRKMNKVTIALQVKPENESGLVKIGFMLRYKYKNLTPAMRPEEQKQSEDANFSPCLLVSLGSIGA